MWVSLREGLSSLKSVVTETCGYALLSPTGFPAVIILWDVLGGSAGGGGALRAPGAGGVVVEGSQILRMIFQSKLAQFPKFSNVSHYSSMFGHRVCNFLTFYRLFKFVRNFTILLCFMILRCTFFFRL